MRVVSPNEVEYVLAGHPPMLHVVPRSESTWVGSPQMALALFDEVTYSSDRLTVAPGDVLVLVTDGLFEVLDREDRELGLEGLRRAVESAARSGTLADIEHAVTETCRAHGAQIVDQTWLIVKIGDDLPAGDAPNPGQSREAATPVRALNS